jgi:hypothetical protein
LKIMEKVIRVGLGGGIVGAGVGAFGGYIVGAILNDPYKGAQIGAGVCGGVGALIGLGKGVVMEEEEAQHWTRGWQRQLQQNDVELGPVGPNLPLNTQQAIPNSSSLDTLVQQDETMTVEPPTPPPPARTRQDVHETVSR